MQSSETLIRAQSSESKSVAPTFLFGLQHFPCLPNVFHSISAQMALTHWSLFSKIDSVPDWSLLSEYQINEIDSQSVQLSNRTWENRTQKVYKILDFYCKKSINVGQQWVIKLHFGTFSTHFLPTFRHNLFQTPEKS